MGSIENAAEHSLKKEDTEETTQLSKEWWQKDKQHTTQKTKDLATSTPTKNWRWNQFP